MCNSNKFGSNTSEAYSTSKEIVENIGESYSDNIARFQNAHFKSLFFNNAFFQTTIPNRPSILYLTSHQKPWALYVWDQIQNPKVCKYYWR